MSDIQQTESAKAARGQTESGRRTILLTSPLGPVKATDRYSARGLDADGGVWWYTGKAGDGWVSRDPADAFVYSTLGEARRKSLVFNRMAVVHGLWFVGVGL